MTELATPPFEEPLLDVDEIQGNVLPGFMKPHMMLISLRFGDITRARAFLASRDVTSLAGVLGSRRRVRHARTLRPSQEQLGAIPNDVDDVWLNVAVSYQGLTELAGNSRAREAQIALFDDEAFKLGLAARSAGLGDPVDKKSNGHPSKWVVGGPGNEADVLLVLAADHSPRLQSAADDQRQAAKEHGLEVLREDIGAKLDHAGSEHFGFQDGISQPGVRGRVSATHFLSPRVVGNEPDKWLYGLPGQFLVWPGEFVFGYPQSSPDPLVPGRVRQDGPSWSRNGSYL